MKETALELLERQGWNYRPAGSDNVAVEICPLCKHDNFKFFMNITDEKNGVWDCKVCSENGNLFKLKKELGIVDSLKESAKSQINVNMPDFEASHQNLITEDRFADVLDHLICDRKLSMETITRQKIGAWERDNQLWFVMPTFDSKGTPTFFKARNLPGHKKRFLGPAGVEAPLYNAEIIQKGMEELFIVEGEMDCISMINQGYINTVGVPGASVKKTEWIKLLDEAEIKTVYLLYDNDKVGKDNSKLMAEKIGIGKCKTILLPEELEGKPVKDVTEFFVNGGSKENLAELKDKAKFFEIDGVNNLLDALDALKLELETRGTLKAEFDTYLPEVNRLVGGFERGEVVGIMAEGKVGKSTLALNLIDYWAQRGYNCFNLCLEMPVTRVVRKWISLTTESYDGPERTEIDLSKIETAKRIAQERAGDLSFGHSRQHDSKTVFEIIRQHVRRYGTDVVVFDNLQMLGRSLEHSAQELSRISKDFKAIAMELNILIILIIQPRRVAQGFEVMARDAFGTSAIEKDVDTMIILHRDRVDNGKIGTAMSNDLSFMETEATFSPEMKIRVDLCRYGPGGTTKVYFDGGISKVRSMPQFEHAHVARDPVVGGLMRVEEEIPQI